MSARQQIAALLARYDDDAWVALANAGLLRRARRELEATVPTVLGESADGVEIGLGERTIRLPLTGPGEATCSCPSPVLCQHILAAGLWLAGTGDAGPPEPRKPPGPEPPGPEPPGPPRPEPPGSKPREPAPESPHTRAPVEALHADLMALDAAALTRYAGLAGYRWAHQFLDDADEPPTLSSQRYLTISFPRPGLTVRYFGGGLDGLVVDQRPAGDQRYRVAAVLAWQRANGLTLPAPPAPRGTTGPASEGARSQGESRDRLRRTVTSLLGDMVRVGVSHLSPAIHERLVTSSVWAQGVQYHRLALLLRRLADRVDLLLARSAQADDVGLLDEIAVAHALVSALESAAASGQEPATLVGRARNAYDPVRSLDLIGLGGRPWRTGSGYHGLTCVFWSSARSRMLTWTDARPITLPGFDPRARWTQPAPWSGLQTPADTAGQQLTLTHAQLSADGRLSGVESTSAAVSPLPGAELQERLPVRASWRELIASPIRGLSDRVDPGAAWAVLRPAKALPARWDATAQLLRWPLLDQDGEVLLVDLPWSRLHAHAIERIETVAGTLAPGSLVVARVHRARGQAVGEPLSLVLPERAANPVDCLHFDPGPARAPGSSLVARLLRSGAPDRVDYETAAQPAAVPIALADLRSLIEREAQRGCAGAPPGSVLGRLARAHADARGVGFTLFGEPERSLDPAEALLRSLYLVQQVELALG